MGGPLGDALGACLQVLGLRTTGRVVGRLRAVADGLLRELFVPAELAEVYGDLARASAAPALRLALDGAIARPVDQLDLQIKQVDEALRVSAGERDRLRQELSGVADRIVGVVTQVDVLLPALRGAQ
ncbi:MAG TPA: hypothetical protein VI357_08235 [Mycobacteriales bacterium]